MFITACQSEGRSNHKKSINFEFYQNRFRGNVPLIKRSISTEAIRNWGKTDLPKFGAHHRRPLSALHHKSIFEILYSIFFPTVTNLYWKTFPWYSRAALWYRFCLKSMVQRTKEWALNKNLRTHNNCLFSFEAWLPLICHWFPRISRWVVERWHLCWILPSEKSQQGQLSQWSRKWNRHGIKDS
jgi:hypothetical protein